ncbi:helix-turn-helix domain-containing protein [Streptomyces sp. NPDC048484]|uniref:LexA family protein n=1 Tax=Streptomyces sp. NPDC048484 TaxID=3155146 RepID=UPI0034213B01
MPSEIPALGRQKKQIIEVIERGTVPRVFSPSIREIAQEVGLSSSSAAYHLKGLEELGLLKRDPGRSRSYEIVTGSDTLDPVPASQGCTCTLGGADSSTEKTPGTISVLQLTLEPAHGHALLKGALLAVQCAEPEASDRAGRAALVGQVVAVMCPCTSGVPLPGRPDTLTAQEHSPAPTADRCPASGRTP